MLGLARSRGVEFGVADYNRMLHVFAKHGDTSQAFVVYLQLKGEPHHAPDVGTYNRIIDACAADGNAQLAATWFGMMQHADSGVQPDVVSYSSVINACAQSGDVPGAVKWLEAMQSSGVPPDVGATAASSTRAPRAATCPGR